MTDRLSPAMTALLNAATDHPQGRAYNGGQTGFTRTHAALIRRGYLADVDGGAGVITDEGRAAIGRPVTADELAQRVADTKAAELAAAERARIDQVARGHGWRPTSGDRVTLPDGTGAEVIGRVGQPYHCLNCGGSHPFPDVVTDRRAVLGHQACELAPTVETARRYLLDRAAHLTTEVERDPGYPAAGRWTAEAAELRAEAARLVGAVVDHDGARISPGTLVEIVAGPGRHGARGRVVAVEVARAVDPATEGSVAVDWRHEGWEQGGITPHNVRVVPENVGSKGDHRVDMDDALTERYLIDRAEHDAHAGDAEAILAEQRAEADEFLSDLDAEAGDQAEAVKPLPGWGYPDRDGVSVRVDGSDEALVVLWSHGGTWTYTIRDLCATLARADEDSVAGAERAEVRAVFLRDGDRLLPGRFDLAAVPAADQPGTVEVTAWVGGVGPGGHAHPVAVGRYRVDVAARPVTGWLTALAYERGRGDYAAGTIDQAAATDEGTGDYYRRGLRDARTRVVDDELRAWAEAGR